MKYINLVVLIGILIALLNIRVAMEKWGNELAYTQVTKIENHYRYDVSSYGTIKLNDNLAFKPLKNINP